MIGEKRGNCNQDGNTNKKKIMVTLDNFVESYLKGDKLYLRLLIAAKRYLNNEREELIFW